MQPLAELNVTSLDEFKFFTFGKVGDKRVGFDKPEDYWLERLADGRLTLHFTLPVKDGAAPKGEPFRVEVYDPTYFVAFEFAKDHPAKLVSAPANCGVDLERPPSPGRRPAEETVRKLLHRPVARREFRRAVLQHAARRCK